MQDAGMIDLGTIEDIPAGQGRCFTVKGAQIAVFRLRDGTIAAIDNACPHRQGPLSDGITGNGKVVCPLHGHAFDLTTGRGSEADECVRTFPVSVKDGRVMMEYKKGSDPFLQGR